MYNPLGGLPAIIRDACVMAVVPSMGTFKDWSGVSTVSVTGSPYWRKGGIQTVSGGYVTVPDSSALDLTAGSLFMSFAEPPRTPVGAGSNKVFIHKRQVGALPANWFWYMKQNGKFGMFNGSSSQELATFTEGFLSTAISFSSTANVYYQDGSLVSSEAGLTYTVNNEPVILGEYNTSGVMDVPYKAGMVFNTELSASQMALLHTWSQNLRTPSRVWPGFGSGNLSRPSRVVQGNQKTASGECIGAWDLGDLRAGTVPDRSGNGIDFESLGGPQKISTPVGDAAGAQTGMGLRSLAAHSLPSAAITLVATFQKSVAGSSTIFYSPQAHLWISGTYLRLTTPGVKDYVSTITIDPGITYRVVAVLNADWSVDYYVNGAYEQTVTHSAGPSSTPGYFYLGASSGGTNLLKGWVKDSEVYNYAWTVDEVTADYEKVARLLTYQDGSEAWRVSLADEGGAIGQRISNTPWKCGDTVGRFKVVDDPTVEGGRAIAAQVNGSVYIRNLTAYGTWEFDLYKTSKCAVYIASSEYARTWPPPLNTLFLFPENDPFYAGWTPSGGSWFYGMVNTAGLLPNNQWNSVRYTRTFDGETHIYYRHEYGPWVLMPPTSGTNPYTDNLVMGSMYTVFYFGGRIANLRHYAGVVTP